MTKLPTSPEALRRLADAMDLRDAVTDFSKIVKNMMMHVRWDNIYDSDEGRDMFSLALSRAIKTNWDLLVTAALADFDKEVLLAHAAVQDSMEETS